MKEYLQTNFKTLEDFLLIASNHLMRLPIDVFTMKFTLGHLAMARLMFLKHEKAELTKYGIAWDLAKLFSDFTTLKISRVDAYKELISSFKLEPISDEDFTMITELDNIGEEVLTMLKNAVGELNVYNSSYQNLYDHLKKEFDED